MPVSFRPGEAERPERRLGLAAAGRAGGRHRSIVRPLTKYAVTVMEPGSRSASTWKRPCIWPNRRGPGPVWIDIPLDVAGAPDRRNDPAGLRSAGRYAGYRSEARSTRRANPANCSLSRNRPLILAGNGIRMAKATREFLQLVERLQVPVLTSWLGIDLIPESHGLFVGRPGPSPLAG